MGTFALKCLEHRKVATNHKKMHTRKVGGGVPKRHVWLCMMQDYPTPGRLDYWQWPPLHACARVPLDPTAS